MEHHNKYHTLRPTLDNHFNAINIWTRSGSNVDCDTGRALLILHDVAIAKESLIKF